MEEAEPTLSVRWEPLFGWPVGGAGDCLETNRGSQTAYPRPRLW
jgi:hypothetical protein